MANNTQLNQNSSSGDVIATLDVSGVKHEKVINEFLDNGGAPVMVSAANPLPVLASIDTTGLATSVNQTTEIAALAAILAKIIAAPSTEAKQDALNALVTTLNSIVATSAKQDTGNASLASIDAKLTNPLPVSGTVNTGLSQPLTDTQLRATPVPVSGTVTATVASITTLGTITNPVGIKGADGSAITSNANPVPISDAGGSLTVDGTVAISGTVPISAAALPLPTGAATSALQTQPGVDIGDVTVNNAAGASAVNIQDGGNSITVDFTQPALVAGSAIIGKVGIDQTTPGTTNGVQVNAALPAGTNVIGHVINDSGSTTAVTGNVTVIQGTATNLKTQSEAYQGGSAVASGNPLQVTLANTGANATAVKTDGSAVTQPVSIAATVSENIAQVNGATVNVGTGAAGTGTQRVTTSTDSTIATVTAVTTVTNPVTVAQATAASLNATVVQGTATNLKAQAENYQGGTAVGAANPLQVTLANTGANATAVKVDGSAVTQPVSIAATVSENIAQVNGATVNVGTGAAGTGTQRVTTSTDSTIATVAAVTSITNALPAGTNAIGKLAANDGIDIGDVTINNAAGASAVNIQDGGNSITVDYATTGSGNATGALRVELPTNGTGVIATVGAVTSITNSLPAGTNLLGSVNQNVVISTTNSTTTNLNAGQVYTGTFEDCSKYGIIYVLVKSDVLSATSGFIIEFSNDGITSQGSTDAYSIAANTLKEFAFNPAGQYYRVKYTNAGSPTASFFVQTVLKGMGLPSSHRINESITDETDAQMVKAVLSGRGEDGIYTNAGISNRGNLNIAIKENDSGVQQTDLLYLILTELRVMNTVLQSGLNVRDDLDNLRSSDQGVSYLKAM